MFIATVELIDIDIEGAVRELLEGFGAQVIRYPIGQPLHLVEVLEAEVRAPYLLINAHGDERGILLPELDAEIASNQPFDQVLTPELVREYGRISGAVVVTTACASGSQSMADAWLAAGASAYVAPSGFPGGADAVMFASHLFWLMLCRLQPLDQAFTAASAIGGDAGMFRLFSPELAR